MKCQSVDPILEKFVESAMRAENESPIEARVEAARAHVNALGGHIDLVTAAQIGESCDLGTLTVLSLNKE